MDFWKENSKYGFNMDLTPLDANTKLSISSESPSKHKSQKSYESINLSVSSSDIDHIIDTPKKSSIYENKKRNNDEIFDIELLVKQIEKKYKKNKNKKKKIKKIKYKNNKNNIYYDDNDNNDISDYPDLPNDLFNDNNNDINNVNNNNNNNNNTSYHSSNNFISYNISMPIPNISNNTNISRQPTYKVVKIKRKSFKRGVTNIYGNTNCKNWKQGQCSFGNKCRYNHKMEIDINKSKKVTNYKCQPCVKPATGNCCNYGNKCNFTHPGEQIRRPMPIIYTDDQYFELLRRDSPTIRYPFGIYL